jgi:hypothetical protein
MASRLGRLAIPLALCGFIGTFGLTLGTVLVAEHAPAGHDDPRPARPVQVKDGSLGILSPAALDRQWVAYSDKSTCADRAGGDGVSAVRLSSSQLAWFFADSFFGPAGPRTGYSKGSGFVHNLVVVQTSAGGHSTFFTVTGGDACAGPGQPGYPLSVVGADAGGGTERYWPGDSLRVGSQLLRFYNNYLPGRLPYIPVGTVIADFAVSQLSRAGRGPAYGEVIRPRLTVVPAYSPGGGTPIVWGTAVLRQGSTVYIYGWQSPSPSSVMRQCYLARVTASRLADLTAWRFYSGDGTWAASQDDARPITSATDLELDSGFSVISAAGHYWLIQGSAVIGSPDIDAYPAVRPWGPFDAGAGIVLYRAPGIGLTAADNYQILYGAQAEPALSSRGALVISYNVNSLAVTAGCVSLADFTNAIVQPRFIAVPRAVFSAAGRGTAGRDFVAAGPPGYPAIVSKNPSGWFDSWAYPRDCPPVPAVRGVFVTPAARSVRVHWASGGIGVQYRVYLSAPGGKYVFLLQARFPQATLPHLTPDTTYQILIVPQNSKSRAGPGTTVTVTTR